MIEPSYALDLGNDTTEPKSNLELASVRGIRSQGLTRGALAYNRLGDLIHPAATIGVVYSRKMHRYGTQEQVSEIKLYIKFISCVSVLAKRQLCRCACLALESLDDVTLATNVCHFDYSCLTGSISRPHRRAFVMPSAMSLRTLGVFLW